MEEIRIPWEDWALGKKLGQGSFGSVYEIHREITCRTEQSAMKVIRLPQSQEELEELQDSGLDDLSIRSRFADQAMEIKKEYGIMAQLKGSTNVVYCDDLQEVVEEDGISRTLYIRMELLSPLVKAVRSSYDPETLTRAVGTDICKALIACEKADIVHRDIKPQNIFVTEDGVYKLGDFGVARTMEKTMNGTKTGTYKYMAPEVYRGEEYGKRVDIYSLGMVLYWLLNEKRGPFLPLPPDSITISQEEEARAKRFSGEPLPPPKNGSEELKEIVLKACAFQPGARYQSAGEMLDALEGKKTDRKQKTAARSRKKITTAPSEKEITAAAERKPEAQPEKSYDADGTVGAFGRHPVTEKKQNPGEGTVGSAFGDQTMREQRDSYEDMQKKIAQQNEAKKREEEERRRQEELQRKQLEETRRHQKIEQEQREKQEEQDRKNSEEKKADTGTGFGGLLISVGIIAVIIYSLTAMSKSEVPGGFLGAVVGFVGIFWWALGIIAIAGIVEFFKKK